MIGNDIVDLPLARKESKWRRKGYLDKVFTTHEQHLIHTAADPDCMVWLLWSMKESAYKIVVRENGKRCFAPIKLACQLSDLNAKSAKGSVRYEEKEYLTKSLLTAQYIATVSTDKSVLPDCKCGNTCPHVSKQECPLLTRKSALQTGKSFFMYSALSADHSWFDHNIVPLDELDEIAYPQQHAILWEKVKQYCSLALSVPEEEIYFHKDETGVPWMTLFSEEKVALSVSHHGRFGAFVISVIYL